MKRANLGAFSSADAGDRPASEAERDTPFGTRFESGGVDAAAARGLASRPVTDLSPVLEAIHELKLRFERFEHGQLLLAEGMQAMESRIRSDFGARFESLEMRVQTLERVVTAHSRVLAETSGLVTENGRQMAVLQRAVLENAGAIRELRAEVRDNRAAIDAATKMLVGRIEALRADFDALRAEVKGQSSRIEALDVRIAVLERETASD